MSVHVTQVDKRFALDMKGVRRAVTKVLRTEKAGGRIIDLIFCRDREIVALNREFKGKNNSTDVLAFDLSERASDQYLGEVYINLQMARRQARRFGVPYSEEVKRLAVHGALHLLGYRDDTAARRARMWARQESFLGNGNNGRRR